MKKKFPEQCNPTTFLYMDLWQVVDFHRLLSLSFLCFEIWGVVVMVYNATFNNISVISWWAVLLVEETRVSGRTLSHNVVSSTPRHELTTFSGDRHFINGIPIFLFYYRGKHTLSSIKICLSNFRSTNVVLVYQSLSLSLVYCQW